MTRVVRYEPRSLVDQLQQEIGRVFEGRYGAGRNGDTIADWVPAVDIRDEDTQFVLHADVPGVDPADIEITLEDSVLTLRGKRESERRDEQHGWQRVERVSGQFYRRFTLPDSADADGVTARSNHGVLEIVIPKQARVQPRRIAVGTS